MKKLITLLIISIVALNSFAQDKTLVDSLNKQLKFHQNDTTACNLLYELSRAYIRNDIDTARYLAKQSYELSKRLAYYPGLANCNYIYGYFASRKGDLPEAIAYYNMALELRYKHNYLTKISKVYNAMSETFMSSGKTPEAMKYALKGFQIAQQQNDSTGISDYYNFLGSYYSSVGDMSKCLMNYTQSFKYNDMKDKRSVAGILNNIGTSYLGLKNNAKAKEYFLKAMQINESIGNKTFLAINLTNLAYLEIQQKNYKQALSYYSRGVQLNTEMQDPGGIAGCYNGIAYCQTQLGQFTAAYQTFEKALAFTKSANDIALFAGIYTDLITLDSLSGNCALQVKHIKLHYQYRDSLNNIEKAKKVVEQQMQFNFDKKEELTKLKQAEKDKVQRIIRNSLLGGLLSLSAFSIVFFRQRNKIKKGKKKSDELLLNILPSEVAEELKDSGSSKAKSFDEVTVMFTDFKDFTNISEKMSPEELVREIDTCFSAFDHIIHKYGVEKIKTIGDAYMCAGGLPVANQSHAEDVVKAALEIRDFMTNHNNEKIAKGEIPFEIRIGINTGPVVAGIVGVRKFAYDIWGDTVNLANRIESHGEAGKVNISGNTYALIEHKFNCTYRGKVMTKGKGEVDMYFVERNEIAQAG